MFKSYIIIALRNLMRNKLYSLINIGGLALGMTVFVFAGILADYERTHDVFFEKSDRIYTLGSLVSGEASERQNRFNGVYSALAPLLAAEVPDIEMTARTVGEEYLLNVGDRSFYQNISFTDKSLLSIFDFDYIAGDSSALDDPSGIVLTERVAKKLFPSGDAMGKVITMSYHSQAEVRVTAIIRDFPRNSHFVSSISNDPDVEVFASLEALIKMKEFEKMGDWGRLSSRDLTYVLLPAHLDGDWLTAQADAVYKRHASETTKQYIKGVDSRRLRDMNVITWDNIGWPVIESLTVFGFLVLLIAGLNYTNLATAQAFSRAKEVGLRKTLGASLPQLLAQFLVESIATAFLAMMVALAFLEVLIPVFNNSLGKAVTLDYITLMPRMILVSLLVGLTAGGYPAYVITRTKPIDALKNALTKGATGSLIRSGMIGAQFVFSIFMLAMVAVVFFQNEKIKESSNIFPRSQIVTLQKTWVGDIPKRRDLLKQEVLKIPGIMGMAYSSQVPFEQRNWTFRVSKLNSDMADSVRLNAINVGFDFIETYEIPLISGRDFSRDRADDLDNGNADQVNVIVNEMTLKQLGFSSVEEALNAPFYQIFTDDVGEEKKQAYVIVGIMADQNFLGLQNEIKPIVFRMAPRFFGEASIRIEGRNFASVITEIKQAWQRVNPDYPIQIKFLDQTFEEEFQIYRMINIALGAFALMAVVLAFIGLFGLAAFMAAGRTKEIGIRKVMGAETFQIVRLLIWKFSSPVVWSLLVALPLSMWAARSYLAYFADRIEYPVILILGAGVMAVVLSWGVVATHAYRVSRRKPIYALRYE